MVKSSLGKIGIETVYTGMSDTMSRMVLKAILVTWSETWRKWESTFTYLRENMPDRENYPQILGLYHVYCIGQYLGGQYGRSRMKALLSRSGWGQSENEDYVMRDLDLVQKTYSFTMKEMGSHWRILVKGIYWSSDLWVLWRNSEGTWEFAMQGTMVA